MVTEYANQKVAAAYAAFPQDSLAIAIALRELVLETARTMPEVGPVTESLKWGQPSYVVKKGTALRIAVPKGGGCGLYAHCQSGVIAHYAATVAGPDKIDGTRGVIFQTVDDVVPERLRLLIRHALTYHKAKGRAG